jgi:hypothetical protein
MQSFKKRERKKTNLFSFFFRLLSRFSVFFSRDSAMRVPINSGRVTCPKKERNETTVTFPPIHPRQAGNEIPPKKKQKTILTVSVIKLQSPPVCVFFFGMDRLVLFLFFFFPSNEKRK